jgi:hypothetical protein
MLPVSLDYFRPVVCEPNLASVSGLFSSCVLWTQCCQCLWITFVLCFVNPMLPVFLDYLRPVFCEPNVASVSGLSSFSVFWTQCCQCLWIIFVLCFVNPMLPVTLDYLRPVFCEPNIASVSGLFSSCVLWTQCWQGNIGFTKHRTKIIQRQWQHWVHETQDEDNPESLATLGSQNTGWR